MRAHSSSQRSQGERPTVRRARRRRLDRDADGLELPAVPPALHGVGAGRRSASPGQSAPAPADRLGRRRPVAARARSVAARRLASMPSAVAAQRRPVAGARRGPCQPGRGQSRLASARSQRTLTGVSPGPPSSIGERLQRPRRRPQLAHLVDQPALPHGHADAAAPRPPRRRRKNSAKPPSASRSRRTMTESYVSSALATRSTSGRGKPRA